MSLLNDLANLLSGGKRDKPRPAMGKSARPVGPAMGRGVDTRDNYTTNRMVGAGTLPANQAEVYAQQRDPMQMNSAPMNGMARFTSPNPQSQLGANPIDPQFGAVGPVNAIPSLQAPQTNWQNTDGRPRNMINPSMMYDPYFWYE